MNSKECKIPKDDCGDFGALITVAQQYVRDRDLKISEFDKFSNFEGKDVFVGNLRKDLDQDRKTISNAIETGEKCGCKEIAMGLLFA